MRGRRNDLTNRRFGKLVVKGFAGTTSSRNSLWYADCDCGTKDVKVVGSQLLNGRTKSCKCLWAENRKRGWDVVRLPNGKASRNQVLSGYKQKAARAGREWVLTDEQADAIMQNICHYCGALPSNCHLAGRHNGSFTYSGIDRLNSSKDYTSDNVVACCWVCNWMKRDLSKEEFLRHVKQIQMHQENTAANGVGA